MDWAGGVARSYGNNFICYLGTHHVVLCTRAHCELAVVAGYLLVVHQQRSLFATKSNLATSLKQLCLWDQTINVSGGLSSNGLTGGDHIPSNGIERPCYQPHVELAGYESMTSGSQFTCGRVEI